MKKDLPTMDEIAKLPLVVDLDGTLTSSDTLIESLLALARTAPTKLFVIPFWLVRGRGWLKECLARSVRLSAELLPYRAEFLSYLREQRATGRRIYLATAAHRSIADAVARHLDLFDNVVASEGSVNLKGARKLSEIQRVAGKKFVYAGDSRADIPIWKFSSAAIPVCANRIALRSIRGAVRIEREFVARPKFFGAWVRALRLHQWVKNLLIFVPAMSAFVLHEPPVLLSLVVAFLSFSLAASSTYLVNDLVDLENDRRHATKRHRPFASGELSSPTGLLVAVVLFVGAIAMAATISNSLLLVVMGYMALAFIYSVRLKGYVLVDVILLAMLFTVRILAGAVAASVVVSSWLLAFSMFFFLGLALVKRCAELVRLDRSNRPAATGRDYRVSDLVVLWPLGVGASLSAVVVFGLFVSAADTHARYASPEVLWMVAVLLVYWLGRVWIKTSRGEMNDDPVVFALVDRGSRVTVALAVALAAGARYVSLGELL